MSYKSFFQTFDFFNGSVKACLLDVSFIEKEADLYSFLPQISAFRQEKCLKFRPLSAKRLSLGAGLALDRLLLPFGLREKDCGYSLGQMEKPYFTNHPELLFNLSHSGDLALACLAIRGQVAELGCDVEEVRSAHLNVAKHCFHPDEYRYLSGIGDLEAENTEKKDSETRDIEADDSDDLSESFTRIWTLKESLIKATGMGLSLPMQDFCFDLSCSPLSFRYPEALLDYHFEERARKGYRIACCIGTIRR